MYDIMMIIVLTIFNNDDIIRLHVYTRSIDRLNLYKILDKILMILILLLSMMMKVVIMMILK